MPTKPTEPTAPKTSGPQDLRTLRPRGSGTGGGGGRERRLTGGRNMRCTGDCGDEQVNPTGPGVAFVRVRRQRTVVLCASCTKKALAAVGVELAPEPVLPSTAREVPGTAPGTVPTTGAP